MRALTDQVLLIVLGAGVVHAVWNAITKYIEDRLLAFALIGAAATIGGGLTLAITGLPAGAAIPYALASAGVHLIYELALMNSYRLGAFGQTYPIARGTSPLVVALGAFLFANESLAALALAGIVVLTAGLITLSVSSGGLARADLPAVAAALLTGLAIASYTLIDGLGVRHAHSPYAYGGLLFLLQGPPFPIVAMMRRPRTVWRSSRVISLGLLAGALSLLAYGAVLWAQARAPLAEVAALRETSVISGALIGTFFFSERFGVRRVAAATLIAAGIIMIAI